MERENEDIIELGAASTETRGADGRFTDLILNQKVAGIENDD
jgi:hypothetical protein